MSYHSFLFSIYKTALDSPKSIAVEYDDCSYTYEDLWNAIDGVTQSIQKKTSVSKKNIIVTSSNKYNLLVFIYATINANHVAIPVYEDDVLLDSLIKSSDYIVTDSIETAERNNDINYLHIQTFSEVADSHEPLNVDLTQIALILHSSGTSGKSKGILLSQNNINMTAMELIDSMSMTKGITEYVSSPVHHAFGFIRMNCILRLGGTAVLAKGIHEPFKGLHLIKKFKCNSISGVSSVFVVFLKFLLSDFKKIGGLINWVEIGSMPMVLQYKRQLIDVLPNAKVYLNYGMTEAMRSTLINLSDNPSKVETVGLPWLENKIKILKKNGEEAAIGEIGHITINASNIALGYWNKEDLWNVKCQNGWFSSGDLGFFDEDGYLIFSGREDEIVNIGGYKYSLLDIEKNIEQENIISDFAIVAIPDSNEVDGHKLVLCVGKETEESAIVIKKIKDILPAIKRPKYFKVLNELPRTHNGKIKRLEIIDMVKNDDLLSF